MTEQNQRKEQKTQRRINDNKQHTINLVHCAAIFDCGLRVRLVRQDHQCGSRCATTIDPQTYGPYVVRLTRNFSCPTDVGFYGPKHLSLHIPIEVLMANN
jgi:hypothetical protein